jgi:hypothetical protein
MNYQNLETEKYKNMDIDIYTLDDESLVVKVKYPCGEIHAEWWEVYGMETAYSLARGFIDRMQIDAKLDEPHCQNEYCQAPFVEKQNPVSLGTVEFSLTKSDPLCQLNVTFESMNNTSNHWIDLNRADVLRLGIEIEKLQNEIKKMIKGI